MLFTKQTKRASKKSDFFFLISSLNWTPSNAAKHQSCQKILLGSLQVHTINDISFQALVCGTLEVYRVVVAQTGYLFEAKENLLLLSWSNLFYRVQTRTRIDLSTIHSFLFINLAFPVLFSMGPFPNFIFLSCITHFQSPSLVFFFFFCLPFRC